MYKDEWKKSSVVLNCLLDIGLLVSYLIPELTITNKSLIPQVLHNRQSQPSYISKTTQTTNLEGVPLLEPTASIFFTMSIPSITLPNTTWCPSSHWVFTYRIKDIQGSYSGNEELRAIGILTSISHRKEARSSVLQLEVLIRELLTID